jgi:uncharacterized protein
MWDEPKRLANVAKHGFDFAELPPEFFLSAKVYEAKEGRSVAIGAFANAATIAVVFRPLGTEAISVISMRPANRKEREQFT